MLEQILELAKAQAGDFLKNETELPNEYAQDAAKQAGKTIFDGLLGEAAGGNTEGVMRLLSGDDAVEGNPIVTKLSQLFGSTLMGKFGLGGQQAGGIASKLMPFLMSTIGSKFKSNDPKDDAFNISELISLAGGVGGVGSVMDKAQDMLGDKGMDMAKDLLGGLFGNKK